jgi:hypothetical protein
MLLRRLSTLLVILLAPIPAQSLKIECDADWEECESVETEDAMFSLLAHRLQMSEKNPDTSFINNLPEKVYVDFADYSCAALGMDGDDGKCVRSEKLPGGRSRIVISQVSRKSLTKPSGIDIALDLDLASGVHTTTYHGAFAKIQTVKNRSLRFAVPALPSTALHLTGETLPSEDVDSTVANGTSRLVRGVNAAVAPKVEDEEDVNVTVETLTVVTVVVASPTEILMVYAGMFGALILVCVFFFCVF